MDMIKMGGRGGGGGWAGLDCTKQPTEYYCTVHMYTKPFLISSKH